MVGALPGEVMHASFPMSVVAFFADPLKVCHAPPAVLLHALRALHFVATLALLSRHFALGTGLGVGPDVSGVSLIFGGLDIIIVIIARDSLMPDDTVSEAGAGAALLALEEGQLGITQTTVAAIRF